MWQMQKEAVKSLFVCGCGCVCGLNDLQTPKVQYVSTIPNLFTLLQTTGLRVKIFQVCRRPENMHKIASQGNLLVLQEPHAR